MLMIMDVAACRMEGWKFMILDGMARCWVGLVDFDSDGIGNHLDVSSPHEWICPDVELQNILREIMSIACPDISEVCRLVRRSAIHLEYLHF